MNIDSMIDSAFKGLSDTAGSIVFYSLKFEVAGVDGPVELKVPLILIWLAAVSVFFTVYLGFMNLRYFKHAFDVLRGKFEEPGDEGEISNWKALAACLSGTVGLGNIAGVAVAVTVGGPGAVFWMIVMGFIGMSTKFAEVMLGVKYRHRHDPAHPDRLSGGPMYYLRDGFNNRGIPFVGPALAGLFAVCCIGGAIGGGNMFQANQTFQQLVNVTGGEASWLADKGWLFGLIFAFLVGIVIIGGIKSIASAASVIVPVMGGVYMLAGFVIIGMNFHNIPEGVAAILGSALTLEAGWGGLLGGLLAGVQRATFSNEAGLGSAAIVHSVVRTSQPVGQGILGMLGPFIDTVIICTTTALVIVFSGVYQPGNGMEGIQLTSRAMAEHISWMPYVLAFTVFMFAYSTIITWFYYALKCLTYLCGEHDWLDLTFKIVFCAFTVVGSAASLENVIAFTDAMMLSMAIPNVIGLYYFAPEIKRDLKNYRQYLEDKWGYGKKIPAST